MATTKGSMFGSARAFVHERYGAEGWAEVTGRFAPKDREELAAIVPVGWYPLPLYARLLRAVDDVHGCGDLALVVQLGRASADRDALALKRAIERLENPSFVAPRLSEIYRRVHDEGDLEIERVSDHHVAGTLRGVSHIDHALCRDLVGYLARLFELAGARHVLVEHPRCVAHGDAECAFQGRWGALRPGAPAVAAAPAPSSRASRPEGDSDSRSLARTSREAFSASIEALSGRHPIVPATGPVHGASHATSPPGSSQAASSQAGARAASRGTRSPSSVPPAARRRAGEG